MRLACSDEKQIREHVGANLSTYYYCISASDATAREPRHVLEYLNKGAANIVFRIRPFLPASSPSFHLVQVQSKGIHVVTLPYQHFSTKVLRISRGRPKHLSGQVILSHFKDAILPLFVPGQLDTLKHTGAREESSPPRLRQVPVQLQIPDLTRHLMEHQGMLVTSSAMQNLFAIADTDAFHVGSGQENGPAARLGILLPDMSSVPGQSMTLEFKPKWLLQSPNAPSDAIRCRTCALQIAIPKDSSTYICPLRLLNGKTQHVRSFIHNSMLSQAAKLPTGVPAQQIITAVVDALVEYLTQGDGKALLNHLRFLQHELDPQGVLLRSSMTSHQSLFDRNLRLAMTLRDCSLFVNVAYRIPTPANAAVVLGKFTSKLGDLDFKSAEKMPDWEAKENSLQSGHLYTKRGENDPDCWLSSSSRIECEEASGI